MKKLKVVIIAFISLLIIVGTGLFLAGYYAPKPGGLRIESDPKASIYINGVLVAETPYQGSQKAGTILLRLVPVGSTENLIPFETQVTLEPGIETVINRNFSASEKTSSGYIISFEKSEPKLSSLMVISDPEDAQVSIDGVSRGFSPYTASSIAPATHVVSVKSPGYTDFSMTVKTIIGYRLTFFVKLGESDQVEPSQEETEGVSQQVVKILDTPTGYLRVRTKPGTGGEEIAQVAPGEEYPYLDTDVATGWYEIQYQASKAGLPAGITGWISNEYATISSGLAE